MLNNIHLDQILIQLLNGLTYGGLLFVIASGFTLIFGLMRVVNMSHGALYLFGAYIGYAFQKQTGNWLFAIIAGTIAVGIMSFLLYWLVQLVKGDLPQTLLTLGIALLISDLCLWIWGGLPITLNAPPQLKTLLNLGIIQFPGFRLFVLLVAILVGLFLWIILYRTQFGRIIRAGVDNREMVSALGINIDLIFMLVFILGGILIGLSGTIGGSYLAFGPGTDFNILTYALVVVVIGGMGSLSGSAVSAILIGLIDSFGRTYIASASIFLLSGTLIIILAFRPQGLFGRPQ
jgi:branched-chain amino acid transport system permease protein